MAKQRSITVAQNPAVISTRLRNRIWQQIPGEVIAEPRLKGALANLECKLVQSLVSGDHAIFIGEAVAADYCMDHSHLFYARVN